MVDPRHSALTAMARLDLPALRRALADGPDLELRDECGLTALAVAARAGNAEGAALLIAAGADVDAPTRSGHGLLHLALGGDHGAVARAVLAAGADPNAATFRGETPLMTAAQHCPALIEALVAAGADPHQKDARGNGPLVYGAEDDDTLRLLLAAGARPTPQALIAAAEAGAAKSVALLLVAGARARAESEDPLIRWLLDHPDDPRAKDLAKPLPPAARVTTWRGRHGGRLWVGVDEVWLHTLEGTRALDLPAFLTGWLDDALPSFFASDLEAARQALAYARRHPTLVARWLGLTR